MTRQFLSFSSLLAGLTMAAVIGGAQPCFAAVIFVDNQFGSDLFDGATEEVVDVRSGPVKTIRRALQMARQGDAIIIANRGLPYYEQLSMNGKHHSGFGLGKFRMMSNGAIVSGANRVPPYAWETAGRDLYRFSPERKGHYQLILDDKAVPEVDVPTDARLLPDIPPGSWAAWRGAIYYKTERYGNPAAREFAFAGESVGLSLSEVHDVVISGLTFRHFRLDGVSVHSQCRNIVLDNVQATENGRAGLFVGETSQAEALECGFTGNRMHGVIIRGKYAFLRAEPDLAEMPEFVD